MPIQCTDCFKRDSVCPDDEKCTRDPKPTSRCPDYEWDGTYTIDDDMGY